MSADNRSKRDVIVCFPIISSYNQTLLYLPLLKPYYIFPTSEGLMLTFSVALHPLPAALTAGATHGPVWHTAGVFWRK